MGYIASTDDYLSYDDFAAMAVLGDEWVANSLDLSIFLDMKHEDVVSMLEIEYDIYRRHDLSYDDDDDRLRAVYFKKVKVRDEDGVFVYFLMKPEGYFMALMCAKSWCSRDAHVLIARQFTEALRAATAAGWKYEPVNHDDD